jgi:3-oxoacyl-[acyl-carrier protein] reductase
MVCKCLVTGATRGIGRGIADQLSKAGYEVVGLARSRPSWWEGEFIECDLAEESALTRAAEELAQHGNYWGLVNNAGMGRWGAIGALTYSDMRLVFAVNTIAPALITKAVAPLMRDGGRIINICSTVMLGKAERTIYGASKAALASMTRTWALELADRGITVNAVSPGPIDTEPFRRRHPVGSDAEALALTKVPVHRVGDVHQVASLVTYLMDRDIYYLTGQVITIDGGGTIAASSA